MSIVQGSVEFPDPSAQKNCFLLLRKLVEGWGEQDQGPDNFTDFIYMQVSAAWCWEIHTPRVEFPFPTVPY